jgi:hypothetical protein
MQVGPVGRMANGAPQISLVTRIAPPVSTVTLYSPSPNTSQLAARMKARRTLRSLGEGGWKGFGEFRKDTSELCSEELHCETIRSNGLQVFRSHLG